MKSPSSGPITRSRGRRSGATTCTSSFRARSEAATSSPMKLAPRMITRRALRAGGNNGLAVPQRPEVEDRAVALRKADRSQLQWPAGELHIRGCCRHPDALVPARLQRGYATVANDT